MVKLQKFTHLTPLRTNLGMSWLSGALYMDQHTRLPWPWKMRHGAFAIRMPRHEQGMICALTLCLPGNGPTLPDKTVHGRVFDGVDQDQMGEICHWLFVCVRRFHWGQHL